MNITRDSVLTLATFFSLVIVFYVVGYWLIFRMGQATPLMLSVGAATILTCIIRKRSLSGLGWHWGQWKYQWLSYLVPFAIALMAYLLVWLLGVADFYDADFLFTQKQKYNLVHWNDASIFLFHFILVATISFFVSLPSILGEEIGWRGLLVPELSKFMSFTGVALVSGLVWSVWHWPLIIKGLYGNDVTPLYYQLIIFSVFIISTGMIMTYLRLKTGSLWTGVIYHMSSNIFIQKVFTPITLQKADSSWYMDEFGVITALVAACAAFYFWRKGRVEFNDLKTL
ncbi:MULTISPECIES: CPBP family intramembrane glutamic endopeptidase [unclassified Shewanella]|uniref:CPBP family intramembrane glutamic endopeptidase n=2 Tax=Shewanella TaxID=22 RepID=UPI0026E22CB6|nr:MULTISPECIES: CPBP family intramembrane glutamic endopeptidase [unclassified Shewanella]MDO6678868.1 CPBP family intramembrane metalloprotease [Shewanella sp. 4_MG-2023]MDO6777281.1 CPBP family intramembrane metalloprotease [Shewanella sp. 3_MG-2023]